MKTVGTIFRGALLLCLLAGVLAVCGAAELREQAQKLQEQGNYNEALEVYRKLLEDPATRGEPSANDLRRAVNCLQNLGRVGEQDALVEAALAGQPDNFLLWRAAAQIYQGGPHWGYIVDGEFERGHQRGGGEYVQSFERDRVRALQLMREVLRRARTKAEGLSWSFYEEFAGIMLSTQQQGGAWKLQVLTDLESLPDYEPGNQYYGYSQEPGAPVDEKGRPLFYDVPGSWEAAVNDGERWRWLLAEEARVSDSRRLGVEMQYAGFLRQQFGVQSMARQWSPHGWGRGPAGAPEDKKSTTYALHTLGEDESIARLASGVKRFKLPAKHNFIRIYQRIAADPQAGGSADSALQQLAEIFADRRQYPQAAAQWQASLERFGGTRADYKRDRLEQITGNWCRFDNTLAQAAGEKARLGFVFRNGEGARFTAHAIDVEKLLGDVKDYLKGNPRELDYEKFNLNDIGHRLVTLNQSKYLGRKVADWEETLSPAENHWDRRIDVVTPLVESGAYFVEARMRDGNRCQIVLWLQDTVIVKKRLRDGTFYYVGDARTGAPVAGANLEFFGWMARHHNRTKNIPLLRKMDVLVQNFAEHTDADGQVQVPAPETRDTYQWLVTARTEGGRHAFLGFDSIWGVSHYPEDGYEATRAYVITDRPVYRPTQEVFFKAWVRHVRYDKDEKESRYAGQQFTVRVHDPRNEKVLEETVVADAHGGFEWHLELGEDATLGVYRCEVDGQGHHAGGTFRVEEYKKPEFEVLVNAPEEPVMLGEEILASIEAKYYFGAPVTSARVKYKVTRTSHDSRWYPARPWDWFYGPGYWWFCGDYDWYPGWALWGCREPYFWWYPPRQDPPEVVLENEVAIGADGRVEIAIDTSLALEIHGDSDHRYEISAEVVDESRRTIYGKGQVLVARAPFQVNAWVDRGYYRVGETIAAQFAALTLDQKPVRGEGELTLYKISYRGGKKPVEKKVETWKLDPGEDGRATQRIAASEKGQYRLSYKVTDTGGHSVEGGYVFVVRGDDFDGREFHFNDLELVTDKQEYRAGETVRLLVNTDRSDSTVLLFLRPVNGVYLPPKVLRLNGKSMVHDIGITKKDMPNFFIEAFTVSGGKVVDAVREVVVPPVQRILNVEVLPAKEDYRPGEEAKVEIRLTDLAGKPFASGSTVVSIYDKALEYISGGSNVPEIREFFWKWRRAHQPFTQHSLQRITGRLTRPKEKTMGFLGAFGYSVADELSLGRGIAGEAREGRMLAKSGAPAAPMAMAMAEASADGFADGDGARALRGGDAAGGGDAPVLIEPVIRSEFADLAFWAGALETDARGIAEISLKMPENLTTWKIRTWAMGHGSRVGQGETEVITSKNLIIRLQAPRFFVETDEVVLSANVHNYLDTAKDARVALELEGGGLALMAGEQAAQSVHIEADGEARIDWRVRVIEEREKTLVRMKALTDEESDGMEMSFPVLVHGIVKTESWSGVLRPEHAKGEFAFTVPEARRPEMTRLEVRYSPTIAGALVDALPYLTDYPYGCTEQTLNRFLPTVITQKLLREMGLDLEDIREKRTNLNPQQIGADQKRAAGWKRSEKQNPVFDEAEVVKMVKAGVNRLTAMQNRDGGWGWFSGYRENSYPHTTGQVVRGLLVARENGVALVPDVLDKGIGWLEGHQRKEVARIKQWMRTKKEGKQFADDTDAFVALVLARCDKSNGDMLDFLYRDRTRLSVYAKALLGIAFDETGDDARRDMLIRNITQFLVEDDENQTAYLALDNGAYWWWWYGSEYEAHAYYLKLLARTDPKGTAASGIVKYLLNNRTHGAYWNSTRDTALCVEAIAEYFVASGESVADLEIDILLDGKQQKTVAVSKENLFSCDNKLVLSGVDLASGAHAIEFRKRGQGPLYYNAYLDNFTLENFIEGTGLEIKVARKFYRLEEVDKKAAVAGSRGQAVEQKVEKYARHALAVGDELVSGDLVEIEFIVESKNDYEYIILEDWKAAGFEPVEVRSGYTGGPLGAYLELRDEKAAFFIQRLPRGTHSLKYRLKAEIPGKFSALPAQLAAMYAPELKGSSDEMKVGIRD